VFIVGAVGPRDLVTNSMAGATHGYSLLWMVVLALVVRYVILDATGRYVLATGESLLAGCGRLGKPVVMLWLFVTVLRQHLSTLTRILLLGTAAHFVLPLPTRYSVAIWGLASWTAGFALMYWGRYRTVERFSKPLALVMGGCLATAAVLSRPDLGALVKGMFTPSLPENVGFYGNAVLVMAMLSAATGSFSNLRYAAYTHDRGWRDVFYLRQQRLDLILSLFGMFVMLALIQAAAVGALQPRGIEVSELEDLIPIFGSVVGVGGIVILGISLWCIVFGTYISSGSGYGIMVSDVYYRFVCPSSDKPEEINKLTPSGMPVYRWWLIYIFVSPLYVFFTDWTPVFLVLLQGVSSIVSLPIVVVAILRLTADRKLMGTQVNGWLSNTVLVLTVIGAIYLSYEGAVELLAPGGGG